MDILIHPLLFRLRRESRDLTQVDLADVSGIGLATIKRIESAKTSRRCRFHTANTLAKAMGVEIEDFEDTGFSRTFDVGGDIELLIDQSTTLEDVYEGLPRIAEMLFRGAQKLKR